MQCCVSIRGKKGPNLGQQRCKQGDLLSSFFINAVIDWENSSLDNHLGFSFGNIQINNLRYADDIVLMVRHGMSSENNLVG